MTPVLSLCFPTYNRASLLDQALRATLGQITPGMADQVEVVILDNASPDDTPAIVQRAQDDFPHVSLRAVRRPRNIGPDANFCDAPSQAQGEFVYLLSDDDVLLPGAVQTLLTLIGKYPQMDAFCLNIRQFWDQPDEPMRASPALGTDRFPEEQDRWLQGRDESLQFLQTHITFLSCITFRRSNVLGRDYSARFATNLAQAYMFLDALAPGQGLYAVRQPYLAQRADNNEGFDFFQVFVTNFSELMQYAAEIGYSEDAVRQVRMRHLRFIYQFVAIFKCRGTWGTLRPNYRDGLARLWSAYGPNRFVLLRLVPAILMPGGLFRRMESMIIARKARRAGRPAAASPG